VQPGGKAAPVNALYQLRLLSSDIPTKTITIECVFWDTVEREFDIVEVWLSPYVYDGNGVEATDDLGAIPVVTATNENSNEIEVTLSRAVGLVTVRIPPLDRQMTSVTGIQCGGGVVQTFFPRVCVPNTTTFYAQVTSAEPTFEMVFTGTLDPPGFESAEGWTLEWEGDALGWQLQDPEFNQVNGLETTRCNPQGLYDGSPTWSVTISIDPFT
jgi:hypothetical protein